LPMTIIEYLERYCGSAGGVPKENDLLVSIERWQVRLSQSGKKIGCRSPNTDFEHGAQTRTKLRDLQLLCPNSARIAASL
jgi:hypothetical protein